MMRQSSCLNIRLEIAPIQKWHFPPFPESFMEKRRLIFNDAQE